MQNNNDDPNCESSLAADINQGNRVPHYIICRTKRTTTTVKSVMPVSDLPKLWRRALAAGRRKEQPAARISP